MLPVGEHPGTRRATADAGLTGLPGCQEHPQLGGRGCRLIHQRQITNCINIGNNMG